MDKTIEICKISALQREESKNHQVSTPISEWKKPPEGIIKCNYDGSWKSILNQVKTGWIFRECYERYIGAGQSMFGHASDSSEAELHALICAICSMHGVKVIKKPCLQGTAKSGLIWLWEISRTSHFIIGYETLGFGHQNSKFATSFGYHGTATKSQIIFRNWMHLKLVLLLIIFYVPRPITAAII